MVSMNNIDSAQLVWNEGEICHESIILELLADAEKMDCMVAFAKTSSFLRLMKALETALARGMKARFAVGLSFYVTEPSALRQLMNLGRKYDLNFNLYLSNCTETFHPKVYAFKGKRQSALLVGSANLTAGGLHANHEASILIAGYSQEFVQAVSKQLDGLVASGSLIEATDEEIDQYERRYMVMNSNHKLALARLSKAQSRAVADDLSLTEILEIMREDPTGEGFEAQMDERTRMLGNADRILHAMASSGQKGLDDFLPRYEELIKSFHSGGLARSKGRIARFAGQFLEGIAQIHPSWRHLPACKAFGLLHDSFIHITGAGINVLTEILHVQNNQRFAVMNQNSVAGLEKAARERLLSPSNSYASRPSKSNVNPAIYADYCQDMDKVRESLGLTNLTELDALFNYVYWKGYQTGGHQF